VVEEAVERRCRGDAGGKGKRWSLGVAVTMEVCGSGGAWE